MVNHANIKLWDDKVGVVVWNNARKVASFEYSSKFAAKGLEVSPLQMPLNTDTVYSFPELNKETFKGLPGLLADSLPDHFGNTLINKWLAEQGRDENSYNPIERLLYQGKRGMGALEFEPAEKITANVSSRIELENLVSIARKALSDKESLRSGLQNEEELQQIIKVGTSAGGARAKAVIAFNETTGEIRSGQLYAPEGFTHWLIKLDGVTNKELGDPEHFGQIEYAYYRMAIDCGVEMTESRLLHEGRRSHFMTRRFDRIGNREKLHTQTLCGLAHFDFNRPGAYSYEQLFQIMRALRLPYSDAEQLFRRMVFNVIARNQDDHTKNFSFLMDKTGLWKLAPAYDMTYSYNPAGAFTSAHQLTINGKRDGFELGDLMQIGQAMHIKKATEIITEVTEAVSKWRQIASELEIPEKTIELIGHTHRLNLLR
ncbi:MAG: type II toxin-antitoxin system HipA family toxin [Candidatus Symbiothrix sp.]|jgi:serine/threonine-protein kinase HipA|nr:type II toxin-antitoxin system HipA family toxin [Candidatus Symbiothrix sp.]